MRVVLLGANGQLGSDLVERHRESRPKWTLRPLIRNDVDVSHPDTLRELLANEQFDALVNCTGYHKTDDVERNATLGFSVNAHAVRAMAEACESKEAAFFHISTDYVFSGSSSRPYSEMDCPRPINVYGASKAMGEVLAASACTKFFSLRVASLFGVAGSSGKGGNFVETMIRIAREKGEISVVDDITMSPTSTSDVSEWIFRLLENRPEPGVFHAVNSGTATWFEFATEILNQTGIKANAIRLSSNEFPTVAQRPRYSALDNTKLAAVVGPIPTWAESLSLYLRRKGHLDLLT